MKRAIRRRPKWTATVAAKALGFDDVIVEERCYLLRCVSPLMAQSRHANMSALYPLSG